LGWDKANEGQEKKFRIKTRRSESEL
jgi:hypothetical protein